MATLTGTTIQSTYDSLLKVTDNDSITGSLKRITDGLGNNTPLYLSSSAVEIVSALNVIGNITATNLSGTNTGDETKASIESKLGAATSSNSGYLTSTDWSTFNNKIAGSGTLNKIAKFSSSSSIADSTITDTGSAVTIGVATTVSGNLTASALIKSGGTASQILAADGSVITAGTNITISGGTISSSGGISGSGTTNTIPKFTGSTAIGNSNITDTGSLITLGSNSYIGGQVGIGTSSLGVHSLTISLQLQNSATIYGVLNNGVAQSTATNAVNYFGTVSNTAAGSYTIPILRHYIANGGTFGAGSVVSTQVGYDVNSTLNGATTNYGFRGRLAAATGVWNLYMDGTANNYMAGALGIGTTTLTGYNINIARNLTGAVTSRGIQQAYTVQSDVTNAAIIYSSAVSTQATAFTLPQLTHYFAGQGTIGAGSTVTDQHGFRVESSLIGATNNYGFRGQIASGTNRWNLYMDGTANNYLAGSLGIGSTSLTGYNLRVSKTITGGAVARGIVQEGVVQSDVTLGLGFANSLSTQAASFTLNDYYHFRIGQGTIGAGSTVTNQHGFFVENTLTGATNNFAFRSDLAAGTGRWSLYMAGTANNYLAGNLGIGTTTPSYPLQVRRAGGAGSLGISIDGVGTTDRTVQYFAIQDSATGVGSGHAFYYRAPSSTTDVLGLLLTEDGRVGIGTTSPSFRLDVNNSIGASSSSNASLTATTSSASGYSYLDFVNTGASGKNYQIGIGGNSAAAGYANNLYFDLVGVGNIMTLTSGRNVGIGTTSPGSYDPSGNNLVVYENGNAGITVATPSTGYGNIFFADGTGSAAAYAGYIEYNHNNDALALGTASAERMRITSGGNVGIGTTSPATRLHINNSAEIRLSNTANTSGFDIGLLGGNADANSYIYQRANSNMIFGTNNAERMRITSAGNVGIGTTSPTDGKLQVAGNTQLGNTICQTYFGVAAYSQWITSTGAFAMGLDGAAGATERMRITSGGNVGIGCTPNYGKVEIQGATTDKRLYIGTNIYYSNSIDILGLSSIGGEIPLGIAGSQIQYYTNATERMRIFSGGNVAIGSSTDNNTGAKLQVTGGMTYQNLFNRRTASYTLTINDQNYIVEMNVGSANNLTVPPNSSVAFPIGTEIAVLQYGAGQTTIVAGSGVTLKSKSNALKISGQYAGCTLVKVGTDEWYVIGDLTL